MASYRIGNTDPRFWTRAPSSFPRPCPISDRYQNYRFLIMEIDKSRGFLILLCAILGSDIAIVYYLVYIAAPMPYIELFTLNA